MMSEDRRRILDMLATGRITAEEAERLLDAVSTPTNAQPGAQFGASTGPRPAPAAGASGPKYLRIEMEKDRGDGRQPKHANIRVPLQLLRAGVRLPGLMPPKTRAALSAALAEKGMDIDLDKLKGDNIESFIDTLTHTSIDMESDDGRTRMKVGCE
jgi:hypothetical protein